MVRLGDVCEINLGKTPPRGSRDCWDTEKFSGNVWVSISDMSNLIDGRIEDSREYITRFAVESVGIPVVAKGTLLLSFKLTLGRTAIAGCDLYTNEAIAALPIRREFKKQIDIAFLIAYFSFIDWNGFAAKDEKLLGKTLNKKKLAEIPIPLPPLSVQREIVARLEKELGEAGKAAEKFKEIAALADAEFKAELDETFKKLEGKVTRRDAETRRVRLGDVGRVAMCKRILKAQTKDVGEVPFYKIGTFGKSPNAYISQALYDEYVKKYSYPKKGDVLISAAGTIGRAVVFDGLPAYFQDSNIVWLEHDRRQILNEYLLYFYLSTLGLFLLRRRRSVKS